MNNTEYYDRLGVSKDASADDIKRAYRKMSKKYHPDINKEPGAEQKYKDVQEAYETLSDSQKRAAYDQYGAAGANGGFGGGAGGLAASMVVALAALRIFSQAFLAVVVCVIPMLRVRVMTFNIG
ncbi:DnaJ domain-containing protein [Streptococcus equi]|uniref:DnaJ domain-containing protein n=1 Tax=Streptococcus equi TaxID=1336 RepID=UPI0039C5D27D